MIDQRAPGPMISLSRAAYDWYECSRRVLFWVAKGLVHE